MELQRIKNRIHQREWWMHCDDSGNWWEAEGSSYIRLVKHDYSVDRFDAYSNVYRKFRHFLEKLFKGKT